MSLLAPFALIEPDWLETLSDDSVHEPSIEPRFYDAEGNPSIGGRSFALPRAATR